MIIEPYADHQGHRKNLAGQHRGNLYCTDCRVLVAEREVTEAELSASAPVAAVVTGDNVARVADRLLLRAYRTRAVTGMHMTAPTGRYLGTVKGFNALTGSTCKTWSDVGVRASELLGESR